MRHFRVLEESEIPPNVMPYIEEVTGFRHSNDPYPIVIDIDLDGQGNLGLQYVLSLNGVPSLEGERVSRWDIRDSATHSGSLIIISKVVEMSKGISERKALESLRDMRSAWKSCESQTLSGFGNAGLLVGALSAIYEMTGRWILCKDEMIRTDAIVDFEEREALLTLGCDPLRGIYCTTYDNNPHEIERNVGVLFTVFFPRVKKTT